MRNSDSPARGLVRGAADTITIRIRIRELLRLGAAARVEVPIGVDKGIDLAAGWTAFEAFR
jgi:hypothetical protein